MRYPKGVDQFPGFFLQYILGLNQRLNLGGQTTIRLFPGPFHGLNVFVITVERIMERQNAFFDSLAPCIKICFCGVEIF